MDFKVFPALCLSSQVSPLKMLSTQYNTTHKDTELQLVQSQGRS